MSLFGKLGKDLGVSKEINIEDYMNSQEMENVDVLNEPADFYVKPLNLESEDDLAAIEDELNKKNILLLDISSMSARPKTLKDLVDKIKDYVNKIDGDVGRIDTGKIIITPAKVKIIKKKKPQ
ncbi:putative cell division protein SepF-like protein [Candidatus Mancarchaeum acidiphilum]|uniref:Putative cell division protein SepF-like protein n=1 Tax=Candidatus Mancarchaeum acidiphilum TaxID=1920749 RepID=A0A218NLU9_9ARCH|nr:cell division protein SepF [Candidatus Mancarchaeum acidiphilum]ASI13431.1 putative cell division protein SepF-like protein [Candidatus Mancarchaeum acidiphilum]